MSIALTTTQDTLSRLDDGAALAVDPELAALFERHSSWDALSCLICSKPGGPECVTCPLDHDQRMRRAEDQ